MSYLWSEKEAFNSPAASAQRMVENPADLLLQPLSFDRAIVVVVYDVHAVCNGGGGGKEKISPQNTTPTHPSPPLESPSRAMKILARPILENPSLNLS